MDVTEENAHAGLQRIRGIRQSHDASGMLQPRHVVLDSEIDRCYEVVNVRG